MRGATVYFMNDPKKGEITFTAYAGMPIEVQTVDPPKLKVIRDDTPIGMDDLLKITRYTYYPVAKLVNAKGLETWNYSCEESKRSKPQTPKRKYKIIQRPKYEEAQLNETRT